MHASPNKTPALAQEWAVWSETTWENLSQRAAAAIAKLQLARAFWMVVPYIMESVVPHLLHIRRRCAEWPAYGIHRSVRTGFHFRTFHWNSLRSQCEWHILMVTIFFSVQDNLNIDAWWYTDVFWTCSGCSEIVPAGFALLLYLWPSLWCWTCALCQWEVVLWQYTTVCRSPHLLVRSR